MLKPGKILCIGLNYRDHAIESGMAIPSVPTVFLKLPNADTGPEADIILPSNSQQPDYKAELATVIGKGGENIRSEDRKQHVLDIQLATNEDTLQHSNTRKLIFKLPQLITHLSSIVPLDPGDVISTGTPAGVGLGREPKCWLKSDEEIMIRIEGIASGLRRDGRSHNSAEIRRNSRRRPHRHSR